MAAPRRTAGPRAPKAPTKKSDSAAFRRARAALAGATAHVRDPELAKRAGAAGGRATADRYRDGPSLWGRRMALCRWHGVPLPGNEAVP